MSRLVRIIALLAALPLVGTIGFWWIEGWSIFDSLYMSVITLSTVGYHEVHPLSASGRVFVMVYLVVGLGVFFYGIVRIGEMIMLAEIREWLEKRQMRGELKTVKNHFIICGVGRMGMAVCRYLKDMDFPFVAIDRDEGVVSRCYDEHWITIDGDATDDETLRLAGIDRARGLAATLTSDADNVYVALSARLLAPNLQIISRASDEKSATKLEKAGANRVISLYHTGAIKMARLMVNPELEDIFEIFSSQDSELDLAEIHVAPESPYAGKTLKDTDFSKDNILIVGIRRADGELILPASYKTEIRLDDQLIAIGKSTDICRL